MQLAPKLLSNKNDVGTFPTHPELQPGVFPPCTNWPPCSSQVISAQQLPKLNKEKKNSIVDPFVRVEIHGVPIDCDKKNTFYKINNGE